MTFDPVETKQSVFAEGNRTENPCELEDVLLTDVEPVRVCFAYLECAVCFFVEDRYWKNAVDGST